MTRTQVWIRELLEQPRPCITLALAGGVEAGRKTEWKNALRGVKEALAGGGEPAERLAARLTAAGAEVNRSEEVRRGVVVLAAPARMEVHRVSAIPPLVRVADRFDVRVLLRLLAESQEKRFYIAALSQKRTRVIRCTEESSEEVPFPHGYSSSLEEALQTEAPDHRLDNRSSAGPSVGTGTVVFGTSSDRDGKDEYLLHFFREVDRAVNVILRGSEDPLVAAGVEHEIALYRRVNTYPHLIEPGIYGAPNALEGGVMRGRGMVLLEERARESGGIPADFDKRVGTGRASIRIPEIVSAAYEGRVSHLFFQESAEYRGTYDARRGVRHMDELREGAVDLIEAAAYETIRQGGAARLVTGSATPHGVPVCALFRYSKAMEESTRSSGASASS